MRKEKFSQKNLMISAGIPQEARKTPFWKRVLELLAASSRTKCGVNLSRISSSAGEGASVVVVDKVLGSGGAPPKLTVAAVAFSTTAKKAIEAAGGKAMGIVEFAKKHPTGTGVVIIK
jgi:large subunit ribosomal protein L18e